MTRNGVGSGALLAVLVLHVRSDDIEKFPFCIETEAKVSERATIYGEACEWREKRGTGDFINCIGPRIGWRVVPSSPREFTRMVEYDRLLRSAKTRERDGQCLSREMDR